MKGDILRHRPTIWATLLLLVVGASAITPSFGQFLPRPPRDPRPERAKLAFETGRFSEAATMLDSYVAENPDNAEAWLFLGWSHYRLGNFEKARRGFERSMKIESGSPDALVGLGYVSLQRGGPVEAMRYFEQALASDSERGDALRGIILAARRHNAPPSVIEAGAKAARRLEVLEGLDVDTAMSATDLGAGEEKRLRPPVVSPRIEVPARAGVDYLEEKMPDGSWRPLFIKGVNLGVTLPGRFASEFPTDESLYRDWLGMISNLGANSVRLYTLLPPTFYRALDWHNSQPGARIIRLIQGVWTELPPGNNFSDIHYVQELQDEIARVIDATHGNIAIGPTQDHAWGSYDRDVSRWLLAYIIGREWEPFAVVAYNDLYPDRTSFDGEWLRVENGHAMECWVAQMCDFAAGYEARQYATLHPLTFANWPTLDPLSHPTEATRAEEDRFRRRLGIPVVELNVLSWDDDAVSLDSTKIIPTAKMKAGFFAAYHIYPNFPDFMNNEYKGESDDQGPNQYVGYLRDLKAYHGNQPVVVAEFGISTSRGIAHVQPLGWHHGGIDERDQGVLVSRMMHNIHDTHYAGAIVFEFIDEWFKGTWSVAPFEIPDERRRFWFNAESPEQSYGIVATRPASVPIRIDGSASDWSTNQIYARD